MKYIGYMTLYFKVVTDDGEILLKYDFDFRKVRAWTMRKLSSGLKKAFRKDGYRVLSVGYCSKEYYEENAGEEIASREFGDLQSE